MTKRKGDAAVTIIIIVVVVLIILVSYFMFFRNMDDENTGNMNNTGTNNETNNQVGIYSNNNTLDNMTNDDVEDTNNNITIADENANNFYNRVKRGITLNGRLVEVPAEYISRLTDRIGEAGYKMTDEASKTVNNKYDEIEKTLADNNVSDINDLDAATKDKVESLIDDIRNVL